MAQNATDTIPRGLDEMSPGILLGAILMSIDIDRLSTRPRGP